MSGNVGLSCGRSLLQSSVMWTDPLKRTISYVWPTPLPPPVWFHPWRCNLSAAEKPPRWWFVVHPNWKQPCGGSCPCPSVFLRNLNLKRWFSLKCAQTDPTQITLKSCSRAKIDAVTLSKQQQQVFSSIITCHYVKNAIIWWPSSSEITALQRAHCFHFNIPYARRMKNCAGMLWERSPTPEETSAGLIGAIVTRWARG